MLARDDAIVKSPRWHNGAAHTKEASSVASSVRDLYRVLITSSCLDEREVISLIY
jgi:hypothetical protein